VDRNRHQLAPQRLFRLLPTTSVPARTDVDGTAGIESEIRSVQSDCRK